MLNVINKFLNIPEGLIFITADKDFRCYKIGFHYDGQIKLKKILLDELSNRSKIIVVLDQNIPYKRQSPLSNKQFNSLHAFNAMQTELFPFETDEAYLALTTMGAHSAQEHYFFSIEKHTLDELLNPIPQDIKAVLVSSDDQKSILEVLGIWFTRLPYMDLLAKPEPFPLQYLFTTSYTLLFSAIILAGIYISIQGYTQHNQEKDEYFKQISLEAEPIIKKRSRTRAMQVAYDEIVQLSHHKSNQALMLLDELYQSAPEQIQLTRINFNNSELSLKGKSTQAEKWLKAVPFKIKSLLIEPSPSFDHFSVTYDLSNKP